MYRYINKSAQSILLMGHRCVEKQTIKTFAIRILHLRFQKSNYKDSSQ
jgi:hypothetical protein